MDSGARLGLKYHAGGVWRFLKHEAVVLTFLIGLITYFTNGFGWIWDHVHPPKADTSISLAKVIAAENSTAQVIGGISQETLDLLKNAQNSEHAAREEAAKLALKLSVTQGAVLSFFQIIGEQNVPDDKVRSKLVEIAVNYMDLRQRVSILAAGSGEEAQLRGAVALITAGKLREADVKLEEAESIVRMRAPSLVRHKEKYEQDMFSLSDIKSVRGDLASTMLLYGLAAKRYEEAASALGFSAPDSAVVRLDQAEALYDLGQATGDIAKIDQSVHIYRESFKVLEKCICAVEKWAHHHFVFGNGILDVQRRLSPDSAHLIGGSRRRF